MNKYSMLLLSAVVAASVASGSAFAQDDDVTLRVDAGSVMTSEGGEFVSASTGKVLVEGQRVMVTEGAKATLVYSDNCQEELADPGVYTVDDDCVAGIILADGSAAAVGSGASAGTGGAIFGARSIPFFIVGAGVVAVALDGGSDNDSNVPVSR